VVNGFSNSYWGWGYENVDLRERLLRRGLVHARRGGTFRSLPHVDLGSHPDGTPTADARRNQAVFQASARARIDKVIVDFPPPP
jgi:N-terminal domain of galactosyltransferase